MAAHPSHDHGPDGVRRPITLRAVSFDHPRMVEPLLAATREYQRLHDNVSVSWDFAPLADFERGSDLRSGSGYDLVTFDHPHSETIATDGLLYDLATLLPSAVIDTLAGDAVGASHRSYLWDGQVLGVRLDAAATFAARRADVPAPQATTFAETIDEIVHDRGASSVLLPLVPTHAGALLVTLVTNLAADDTDGEIGWPGFASDPALRAITLLQRVWPHVAPESVRLNPIQVLESMARHREHSYSPFVFGYAPYADSRRHDDRLVFGPSPAVTTRGPLRGMLGGAGLGVHHESAHPAASAQFAAWLGSAEVQRQFFVALGGQPAALSAWDAGCRDPHFAPFFTNTRTAMTEAFVRSRRSGFATLQTEAGRILTAGLTSGASETELRAALAAAERTLMAPGPRHGQHTLNAHLSDTHASMQGGSS